ncbi:MAG: penicillin-binding protein [Bacilli bacterium]|nr:penicillin-binding protein [Bacilli bacterium]
MKPAKKPLWNAPIWAFLIYIIVIVCLFMQLTYLSLSPTIYGINMDQFAKQRNTVSTTLYANRGTIYDNEGNILALNVSSYTVIAYLSESRTGSSSTLQHVADKEMTAKELAPILNMTEEYIIELLNSNAYQVELGPGGRGITELTKQKIDDLNLPGIDFIETHKRYYPNGDFASYIIGYAKEYEEVNSDNETVYNIVGELGIEAKFDDILDGDDGSLVYQQDQYGYKIPDTTEDRTDAVNGSNIYLTLDSNIQRFIEEAVKDAAEDYDPEWIQLTVMDAKTGEILGTSSSPSFDPNIKNITNYENPLVSYVYEPGSTMKIFTYMCAMESGNYVGSDTYESGSITIGEDTINDWNKKGWGLISYDKGFEYSSNVGVVNLIQKVIDKSTLQECLSNYGFGVKTGIDLPREMTGDISFTYPIEVATAAFGQGITTTAIQQLQALTMLANDGKIVTPQIVSKIVDTNTGETTYENEIEISNQIVSTATINKIKELMYNVVYGTDNGTTGRSYQVDGVEFIAKTGTAQIYDMETGKYLTGSNDYIYSVVGLFPYDDPSIIIYAAMKQPNYGGSTALSTAVKQVVKNVSKYLDLTETTDTSVMTTTVLDSYISSDVDTVKQALEDVNLNVIVIGDGTKVISQYPASSTTVIEGDKVFLLTNSSNYTMPNIIGWSRADVTNFCNLIGLGCEFENYGYVIEQSITKNSTINSENKLTVTLKEKDYLNSHEEE